MKAFPSTLLSNLLVIRPKLENPQSSSFLIFFSFFQSIEINIMQTSVMSKNVYYLHAEVR